MKTESSHTPEGEKFTGWEADVRGKLCHPGLLEAGNQFLLPELGLKKNLVVQQNFFASFQRRWILKKKYLKTRLDIGLKIPETEPRYFLAFAPPRHK